MYTFFFLVIHLPVFSLARVKNESNLDFSRFLVWGPGLRADFFMPVRYFYIQTVDFQSNNLTYSSGRDLFKVKISSRRENEELVRAYVEILDFNDGVYLVRYRLVKSYQDLVITIKNKYNKHVANSPYYLNGDVYDENCYCPETNLTEWYKLMKCSDHYTQLENDMRKFENQSIDMDEAGELIIKKYFKPYTHSFCNYVILKNKIYKQCYGEYTGFSDFVDETLTSIARKVKLPDLELFWNLGDWPLNLKLDRLLPIVSWCGSNQANDLILPTYDLTESNIFMMARVGLDLFTVRANTGPKWAEKISKAFWRGRDSRQERLDLVEMSREHRPDLIDAALTAMFFFTDEESVKKYGPKANRTPFYEFFNYKYQLNIDGTVAAYRLPYLLAGDALIFKQDSGYYEHFYADLEPYVHYVPVKRDLTDLIEKLEWAKENDEVMQAIVKNAQSYVRLNLTPNHIYCYHVKFLHAYSKIITSRVRVRPGMKELINNVDDDDDDEEIDSKSKSRSSRNYKCQCRQRQESQQQAAAATQSYDELDNQVDDEL